MGRSQIRHKCWKPGYMQGVQETCTDIISSSYHITCYGAPSVAQGCHSIQQTLGLY